MNQRTIRTEAGLSGVGLHTGNLCHLTFRPAPVGTGIVFVRLDLPDHPRIPADVSHVVGLDRGTSLGVDGAKVHTVEHVLAAVAALRIDNLLIELDANEPPVGDGSALPFFLLLKQAGIVQLDGAREPFSLTRPFHYNEGEVQFTLIPSEHFQITFSIDFSHPAIGHQYASFEITPETFERELAPARTFGFLHEVERLKAQGLIRGGSLENAIVLDEASILNDEHLRFPNEFVRHKILDLIGDLSLFGREIRAHVISNRSGHKANVNLVQALVRAACGETNGGDGRPDPWRDASQSRVPAAVFAVVGPVSEPAWAAAPVDGQAGSRTRSGALSADAKATSSAREPLAVGSASGLDKTAVAAGAAAPERGPVTQDGEAAGRAHRRASLPGATSRAPAAEPAPGGRSVGAPFGVERILEVLPHRFPFALVDRVLEIEREKRIVGVKNVTLNEPFFVGHFPGRPIMPGVLIVEAMGQVGGLLLLQSVEAPETKLVYFTALDGVKFRRPVVPGDQLRIEMRMLKLRGRTCRMAGEAYVGDARVAEATMSAVLVDRAEAAGSG